MDSDMCAEKAIEQELDEVRDSLVGLKRKADEAYRAGQAANQAHQDARERGRTLVIAWRVLQGLRPYEQHEIDAELRPRPRFGDELDCDEADPR